MFQENQCPLCQREARLYLFNSIDASVKCEKCAAFRITRVLYDTMLRPDVLEPETKELLPYLSAHTRQASERGEEIVLESNNWKVFASAHLNTPVSTKLTRLMELIASRSRPGIPAKLDVETDAPLLDAVDQKEMNFLVDTLAQVGNIKNSGGGWVRLEAKGWEQIQSARMGGIPGRCFVAMSFEESLKKPIYDDGIYKAVKEDCKMEPVRIDLVPHNDNIIDKIIAEIRTCQFMVADFTGQKCGVYFEAGFAKGLGREVIWTCREDDFENVHFDIAQFSHIIWNNSDDLRTKLAHRIKATIAPR